MTLEMGKLPPLSPAGTTPLEWPCRRPSCRHQRGVHTRDLDPLRRSAWRNAEGRCQLCGCDEYLGDKGRT